MILTETGVNRRN